MDIKTEFNKDITMTPQIRLGATMDDDSIEDLIVVQFKGKGLPSAVIAITLTLTDDHIKFMKKYGVLRDYINYKE